MTLRSEFDREIAHHNRHVVVAAAGSLIGAGFLWLLAAGVAAGLALFLRTITNMEAALDGSLRGMLPWWESPVAFGLIFALIVWGLADRHMLRNRPPSDRPILGIHLIGDVFLLPIRLTFGAWDDISALIFLSRRERSLAIELMAYVYQHRCCKSSSLRGVFIDGAHLPRVLAALQMIGWLALLEKESSWCYIIPSAAEEGYRNLLKENSEGTPT